MPHPWTSPAVNIMLGESCVTDDEQSLSLGLGSTQARHLEGLLELGFCRLDPSIGMMGQASGSARPITSSTY